MTTVEERLLEAKEQAWIMGRRSAWNTLLGKCLQELGVNDPEADRARWLLQREELLAMLRRYCAYYGDNEWPDDLNLADALEKHLMRHLVEGREAR